MTSQLKKFLIPLLILCALAALGYHLFYRPIAPEITFTTIKNEKISMASLKGKMVLVSFWATDCPSCIEEMPDLVNTYNAYKNKGFEVIAIAMPYDPPQQLLNFVTQKKLPFPVVHDSFGEMIDKFGGVYATPTAILFDKNGQRLQRTTGILDFADLHAALDKALG